MTLSIGTPPASPSLILLGKATLGSANATIKVSGIPAGYKRFYIAFGGFFTGAPTKVELLINDAVTNYQSRLIFGQSSPVSSVANTTGIMVVSNSTGATRCTADITIMNFTSQAKLCSGTGWADDNAGANYPNVIGGVYTPTAEITSLSMVVTGTTWTTATVLYVYGSAE